jgi:hypothetical protein
VIVSVGLLTGFTSLRRSALNKSIGASNKPTLIDLEAEMANRAQAARQRERLSETALKKLSDAIVRPHTNNQV